MQIGIKKRVVQHSVHQACKSPSQLQTGFPRFSGWLPRAQFLAERAQIATIPSQADKGSLQGAAFFQVGGQERLQISRSQVRLSASVSSPKE